MSDYEFCGTICWAARMLGYKLIKQEDNYIWFDEQGTQFPTLGFKDPKERLKAACELLIEKISLFKK